MRDNSSRIFICFALACSAFLISCLCIAYVEKQAIRVHVLSSDQWNSKDAFYVLNDPSEGPRHIYALGRIRDLGADNDPNDFIPLIHKHPSETVRQGLIEFIAMSSFTELHKELVFSLDDESSVVVKSAIWANGYVRNTEAAPKVLNHLINGERYYSLPTLARIGNKEQIPILESIIKSENDEEARRKIQLTIISIKLRQEKLEFPVSPRQK